MRMKLTITTLLFCLLTAPVMTGAQQDRGQTARPSANQPAGREPRIALVIGNAGYREARLPNPLNDARDVAAALRSMGFDVTSGEDRDRRQMVTLIREFGQKLRNGGVGLFYFAGHGVQVGGRNYLVPINAEITAEAEVEFEAVEVGFALAQMEEARNRLNIVILDACRNNPYARSFRSGSRGLAGIRGAPSGTLIAYATAADEVASDGAGRNGLFTGELVVQMKKPGATLEQVFRRTRTSVKEKSKGRQVPYEYSSVEGDEDFYFIPPVAPEPPRPTPVVSEEQSAWERAKARRTAEAVRAFLSLYPNSKFENEARELLATLEPATPPVRPSPYRTTSFTTAKVVNGRIEKSQSQCDLLVEDLGAGVTIELARIPAGRFQMGSPANEEGRYKDEDPQHEVRVGEFWLGRYEVTQRQWRAVAALPKVKLDLKADPSNFKGDDLPVESVSWEEVKEFIARLNRKLGLTEQSGYRLPSEAEWEYAARAGTTTRYAFGDEFSSSLINTSGKTVAVGSLGVANAWGLFDMHGNVWEWCEDHWHGNYDGAPTDGSAWVDISEGASRRVGRGGSWGYFAAYCRSADRDHYSPDYRDRYLGFRLSGTYR